MFKKILACLCILSLLLAGCGGNTSEDAPETTPKVKVEKGAPIGTNRAEEPAFSTFELSMSLDDNGELAIDRKTGPKVPMGPEDTWTVFVYLCGTDLETDASCATDNIIEMQDASTGSNVRFVLETGATLNWHNDTIDASKLERYVICDGKMTFMDSVPDASMGEPETLVDFLRWGVETYPAEKMGVIFWDHGGGSVSGVCFDERHDYNSLTLLEIDKALTEITGEMTDRFEFISFDACLMDTVECANILATYARFMYASQNVEPGCGWPYEAMGDFLGENPSADGAALGKALCDAYYDKCQEEDVLQDITLATIDLSKIDPLVKAFHTYTRNLHDATEDHSVLTGLIRNMNGAKNYGANNKTEGYTNMADLAAFVRAGAKYASGADKVLSTIGDAVIYMRNGPNQSNACGLSVYYPFAIQGTTELRTYGGIAPGPYYLALVDRFAYLADGKGLHDSGDLLSVWDQQWNGGAPEWDTCWDGMDLETGGESTLIEFYDEPFVDENGVFSFSLTDESLENTAAVQAIVYMASNDGEDLIEMGSSGAYVLSDWENGIFSDDFDGNWFSLPDGQNLAVYPVYEGDGYTVYTSPIRLNGGETNLRLSHHYGDSGLVTIDGVWDGVEANGMSARSSRKLAPGDIIVPLYNATAFGSDEPFQYYGREYTWEKDVELYFNRLDDGTYYFAFSIDDIYGDNRTTDYACFSVENGELFFKSAA